MHARDEILAQITKPVSEAGFGDVLRIMWTTYYFGADSRWHNARTGHVEPASTLTKEQEAAGDDWEWMIPGLTARALTS